TVSSRAATASSRATTVSSRATAMSSRAQRGIFGQTPAGQDRCARDDTDRAAERLSRTTSPPTDNTAKRDHAQAPTLAAGGLHEAQRHAVAFADRAVLLRVRGVVVVARRQGPHAV